MRHVGVREFRDKATTLLAGDEKLVIERHGQAIGYYIPVKPKDKASVQQALERFNTALEGFLEGTGMTEDQLFDELAKDRKG